MKFVVNKNVFNAQKVLVEDLRNILTVNTKCQRCGECCGPILVSEPEAIEILKFLNDNKLWKTVHDAIKSKHKENDMDKRLSCPMLSKDEGKAKCLIYDVRPLSCRAFGVVKTMWMTCPKIGTLGESRSIYRMYEEILRANPLLLTDILIQYMKEEGRKKDGA